MFELVQALNDGAELLKKRVPNPIGLTAGCELFIGFVTLFPHESAVSQYANVIPLSASCGHYRTKEFFRAQEGDCPPGEKLYISCRQISLQDSRTHAWIHQGRLCGTLRIYRCLGVSEVLQILTHSYSRVITQALLHAHTRKRISVYVTEARPRGLGCADLIPIPPLTPRIRML